MKHHQLRTTGDYGERVVRRLIGGAGPKWFVTALGNRFFDNYLPKADKGIEVKTGYFSVSIETIFELEKDHWLLANGQVRSVEWWFVDSPNTGKGGLSSRLADELTDAGIVIKFYPEESGRRASRLRNTPSSWRQSMIRSQGFARPLPS